MAAVSQIRYRGTEGRVYYEKKIGEGMTGKCALRALKRKISDALYVRMISDARLRTSGGGQGPGGQSGTTLTPARPAPTPKHQLFGQATPGPGPTLGLRPMSGCSHPGLLLLSAEPAGAQPESTWSPARARAAGAGRNDVDAGEHRPQSPAQEQATKNLTPKRSRSGRRHASR